MHHDPFHHVGPNLNRDLAVIGLAIVAAAALVGAGIGKVIDLLVHHHAEPRRAPR